MWGRRRIGITRSKTGIKAQAGGVVRRYTRGASVAFGFAQPVSASGSPDAACRSVGNLTPPH